VKHSRQWLLIAGLAATSPTFAGVYADDLSKCLVEATTLEDRITLVRWIFTAVSAHPAVASMTSASPADVEKSNAKAGALFMRLLTETCLDVSKKAIKYEGPLAIQLSFQVLGQVATTEMFSHPDVAKVMAGLDKHVDAKKLEALKQ
jgi:hypothetical protein